jgi:hypothetical protein
VQGSQLGVIQTTGHFFSITGHKGHGCAIVQQGDGGSHLCLTDIQFFGDDPRNI